MGAVLVVATAPDHVFAGFVCTGTLVTPELVLTAAHCLDALEGPERIAAYVSFSADVRRFGVDGPELPPLSYRVGRAVAHPHFDDTERPYDDLGASFDMALLFLERPVSDIEPIPLARSPAREGDPVVVVGYGHAAEDPDVEATGLRARGDSVVRRVGSHELEIGAPGGARKCYGDSGGPTLRWIDGRPRVVGVSSRDLGRDTSCRISGVDVRADLFATWIRAESDGAGRGGSPPRCSGLGDGAGLWWLLLAGVRGRGRGRRCTRPRRSVERGRHGRTRGRSSESRRRTGGRDHRSARSPR